MNDEANFLAAIIARPLDDLPRLIYADRLEETTGMAKCSRCIDGWIGCVFRDEDGDRSRTSKAKCDTCHGTGSVSNGHVERAEFVRVQCELARPSDCKTCNGRRWYELAGGDESDDCVVCSAALRRRERELLQRHWQKWAIPIPAADGRDFTYCANIYPHDPPPHNWLRFRRGFVEEVALSWPDFRTHADAIRRATPLTEVTFAGEPPWDDAADFNYGDKITHPAYPGITFKTPDDFAPPLATRRPVGKDEGHGSSAG